MSAEVEPQEVQAILEAVRPAAPAGRAGSGQVAARDFARPLRLSPRQLEDLRGRLQGSLGLCEKELARALRGNASLELAELSEVSAEGLFADLAQPFAVARFEVGSQPGWAVWEIQGALGAVETALGALQPATAARGLSAVERRLLEKLFAALLSRLVSGLGIDVQRLRVLEKAEEAGTWHEGGAAADRQRLRLHLVLEGPGGTSAIDLYLPGVAARPSAETPPREVLPAHLRAVVVEISARLGRSDIAFGELLEIEVGDVVPLSTPVGAPLRVLAEGVDCAAARLGCSDGQLAIQIELVGESADEEP